MGSKRGPHADLVKAGVDLLTLYGVFCWVNNTGRLPDKNGRWVSFGKVGSADILGVLPGGRFFGAEAKIGKDVVSDKQADWMGSVHANGGYVSVFRNLDELERDLQEASHAENDDRRSD